MNELSLLSGFERESLALVTASKDNAARFKKHGALVYDYVARHKNDKAFAKHPVAFNYGTQEQFLVDSPTLSDIAERVAKGEG